MTKIFEAPVKRANWSVHYLESGGQSARGNPLCEIAMGSAKEGPREESDRFLSLFRRSRPPLIHAHPGASQQWPSRRDKS